MIRYQDWKTDQDNWQALKARADALAREITAGRIRSREELESRIREVYDFCLERFPDKEDLFNLIYRSRFLRLWEQFGLEPKS